MPKQSRKAAIDQLCKDCIYDPEFGNGTWRKQVQNCTSTDCAVYPFRPVPQKRTKTDLEKT